jgi:hypothetical protein
MEAGRAVQHVGEGVVGVGSRIPTRGGVNRRF